ncbi:unnamed protein product [Ectocarpus sp. 6 AP-2014]
MSSEDRAALVALFRSTGGTRWRRNDNWDTGADLSQWQGVKVNEDGRVVVLQLPSYNVEGTIPEALGALTELKKLYLSDNKLTGPIPAALGALKKLKALSLGWNKLTGPVPEVLGALKELVTLLLHDNKLTGTIPEALGALTELKKLYLSDNKLTGRIPEALRALKELTQHLSEPRWFLFYAGPIPEALGALKKLKALSLGWNKLTGEKTWVCWNMGGCLKRVQYQVEHVKRPIPEALGALKELVTLRLHDNKLTGHIPKELGNLENLQALNVENNNLTGAIPTELGNLRLLSTLGFGNNGPNSIWRRRKKLSGGPAEGEGLRSWKERIRPKKETKPRTLKSDEQEEGAPVPPPPPSPVMLPQQQETGEGDAKDKGAPDAPVLLDSPNQIQETVGERVRSPEHASLSPRKEEEVDRMFSAQLSSSAGLDSIIRENPGALEDIQRVIESTVAGRFHPDDELSDMDRRRKLGTLVTMSKVLGEVALRHTEDMDVQRKELALPPFLKAYCTAVRGGLCQAYLAASVIESDWVSTSKTSGMGKAGAALKLMSSAVPVVGGLPELAGKALEAGDHYFQTRRLVKITAMAPDAVECCSLARRLALQITDVLRNDAGATADNADEVRVDTTAGVNGGADITPGDMSEEDVFEYLLEEVASYKLNDHGGVRLGKKHLRKLLKAIQRGSLDGSNGTEQKIEVLVLEIFPEADTRPAVTLSTPKEVIVRSPPVVTPAHEGGLPSRAEFTAMQAALKALKFDRETQQAELEELHAAKDKQQEDLEEQLAKIEAVESRNKQLREKVAAMEKRVPEGDCEPCDRGNT